MSNVILGIDFRKMRDVRDSVRWMKGFNPEMFKPAIEAEAEVYRDEVKKVVKRHKEAA